MTTATTDLNYTPAQPAPEAQAKTRNTGKFDVSVTRDEIGFALLAVVVLAAWIGAIFTLGVAGLIGGALTMVAVLYAVLVIISRG